MLRIVSVAVFGLMRRTAELFLVDLELKRSVNMLHETALLPQTYYCWLLEPFNEVFAKTPPGFSAGNCQNNELFYIYILTVGRGRFTIHVKPLITQWVISSSQQYYVKKLIVVNMIHIQFIVVVGFMN